MIISMIYTFGIKGWVGCDRISEYFKHLQIDSVAAVPPRSSSQTEGRNGYLAFINHDHRGFPKNRLQALTVIHNYDVRRVHCSRSVFR